MSNPIELPDLDRQFRKKPVVIEAIQWAGNNLPEVMEFAGPAKADARLDLDGLKIYTLEGTMRASIGDWIIRGVKGELYPCKPDIFDATYEPALAAQSQGADEQASAAPAPVKDHVVREVVNELRDIAKQYHNTEQLRARLRSAIDPLLNATKEQNEKI